MRDLSSVQRPFFLLFIILAFSGIIVSCGSKESKEISIELPPTQILSVRSNWAVITGSHLRLREQPSTDSRAVTTLWRGNVLEIISREDLKVQVEGIEDYWYQVAYDGLQGWVFGGYIDLHETEENARQASRALQE
ncbi:MAG: SH3 domain-containing protein [Spirochaetia bacterium]